MKKLINFIANILYPVKVCGKTHINEYMTKKYGSN
jgi:hypothetical protein